MDQGTVIDIAQSALRTMLLVSAPVLGLSLLVGLVVSIFQATTQIQEQTLTFVPKIIAVIVSMIVFGPWMIKVMMEFTQNIFTSMNQLIK